MDLDLIRELHAEILVEATNSEIPQGIKNIVISGDAGVSFMEGITAILIVFMVIVLPIWLFFHYLSKMRTNRGLTAEDEKMLVELWETANRMEQRIQSLEIILDSEAPEWRSQYEGSQHER